MTDKEALDIIRQATEPQIQGRITRSGYAQIEAAIAHLDDRLRALPEPEEKKP